MKKAIARGFTVKVPARLIRPVSLPASVEGSIDVQGRTVSLGAKPLGLVLRGEGHLARPQAADGRLGQQRSTGHEDRRHEPDQAQDRGRGDGRRAIGIDPEFGDDVYAKLGNIAYKTGRKVVSRTKKVVY